MKNESPVTQPDFQPCYFVAVTPFLEGGSVPITNEPLPINVDATRFAIPFIFRQQQTTSYHVVNTAPISMRGL